MLTEIAIFVIPVLTGIALIWALRWVRRKNRWINTTYRAPRHEDFPADLLDGRYRDAFRKAFFGSSRSLAMVGQSLMILIIAGVVVFVVIALSVFLWMT